MPANRLISWFAVPDGSTLKVQVTGSDANFNVTGIQITTPGGVTNLSHAALVAGKSQKVASPKSYSITLATAFLGENATTVTVQATVTKPDGNPYGKPRPPHVASGKAGDTDSALVLAVTKQ